MTDGPTDAYDPFTAYLAMHTGMINEADTAPGVRLNAWYALGYLQALFDIKRIQPDIYMKHREDIERLKNARLDEVGAKGEGNPITRYE